MWPRTSIRACPYCTPPARAVYRVGGLWGPAHAIASDPLLVAYRFPDLGNSHGGTAVALFFNALGELAGTKRGSADTKELLLHYLD
jgi:hypothetical protein